MKTKLEMAHEWAMKHGNAETVGSRQNMVKYAWEYADAMQAEAEKRKPSGLPESLRERHDFTEAIAKGGENYEKEEWQPDWSQEPRCDVVAWAINEHGQGRWIASDNGYYLAPSFGYYLAPSFGYDGDWRNSLRKRPE